MNVCLYLVLHRIMLSSVEYPAVQHFPHYLINGTIFRKTVVEHKMCFNFLRKICLKRYSF
jgi:hypothetical protein